MNVGSQLKMWGGCGGSGNPTTEMGVSVGRGCAPPEHSQAGVSWGVSRGSIISIVIHLPSFLLSGV